MSSNLLQQSRKMNTPALGWLHNGQSVEKKKQLQMRMLLVKNMNETRIDKFFC